MQQIQLHVKPTMAHALCRVNLGAWSFPCRKTAASHIHTETARFAFLQRLFLGSGMLTTYERCLPDSIGQRGDLTWLDSIGVSILISQSSVAITIDGAT